MKFLAIVPFLVALVPVAHADDKCQTRMLSPTPLHEEAACFDWETSEVVPPRSVKVEPILDPHRVSDMVVLKQPYGFTEPVDVADGPVVSDQQ